MAANYADRSWRNAPRASPQTVNAESLFQRGLSAYSEARWEAAETDFRAGPSRQPAHARARHVLGLVAVVAVLQKA